MSDTLDHTIPNKDMHDTMTTIGERLKYVYSGTLKDFTVEQILPFWNEVYQSFFSKKYSVPQFYEALWNGMVEPPFYTVFSILNSLEFYLLKNHADPVQFIYKTLPSLSKGLIISSERVLLLSNPYLSEFFNSKDLHGTILRVFSNLALSSEIQRETCHRLLHHKNEGEYSSAIMMYKFLKKSMEGMPFKRFPAYDFEIWTASQIQSVAESFSLPSFEITMLADYRLITDIIEGSRTVCKDDIVYLNDERFGRVTSFYDIFSEQKPELIDADVQDCSVVIAEKDYLCPVRKRVVIHKGCVYGAPLYLYNLRYPNEFERPANFLSIVIAGLQEQRSEMWLSLKQKHNTLISRALRKLKIEYDCADESISINGVHFISGVPAKIFKKILSVYSSTRRVEFQYREFTKDSKIVNDPLNPNFVVRLTRLTKALENAYPELQIIKVAPGRIMLDISCEICYSEK